MNNNNFEYWRTEIADMPEKDQDGWYDLETGLRFDPHYNYAKPQIKKSLSQKALDARKIAKKFGGKALSGTSKQIEWAEQIRAEKITNIDIEHAKMLCNPMSLGRYAKFWINNRNKKSKEFEKFISDQQELSLKASKFREQNQNEEYKKIATQYNTLTAAWGFE